MKKDFNPSEWLGKKKSSLSPNPVIPNTEKGGSPEPPVSSSPESSQYSEFSDLETEIEQLVCSIESASADIAPDYASWRDLAFALADALGEGGRSYFHRLSRFYCGYDEREADKQFTACLRSHGSGITINTLFHLAKQSGISLPKAPTASKAPIRPIRPIGPISPISNPSPSESSESCESSESPDPLPTFSNEIYSLLPGFLSDIISKASNYEDADLLILGSLTAISACLPNVSGIYAEREVFPNLFTFVSAPASAGKGRLTSCRYLIKPIHDNLKQLNKLEMEEYHRQLNEYNQDKKSHEQPAEPPIRTLLIPANSSATAVYQMLNDNQGIGIILETEGDTLANTFKSDYGNFSDGFRKAFHHEMISYTRRKDREFVELARPRLSALLSGTPRQVLSLIPDAENGLFSRFIFYNKSLILEWLNVFAASDNTIDQYFEHLGHRFFAFYQTLQQSQLIRFSLTAPQQLEFNQFFGDVQLQYSSLFGLDIVASVRRLGLITFRLAMILTTLRFMDGVAITPVALCSDTDFRTSLIMARVLLQHTAHVFSNLPTAKTDTASHRPNVNMSSFLNSLPAEFDRQTYLSVAQQLRITPRTAESYIHRLCASGQLQHPSYGSYIKPQK